jgi:nicotinate-nucleotide adenylyltransferase
MSVVLSGRDRIGVLGGTFDPIHHGHLLMAREAARILDLDTVLFVPAGEPSHRNPAGISSVGHRCAMVSDAIRDEPRFSISMVDAERPRPTYTFDTLHDLRSTYGADIDFFFIVGADNLASIPQWYRGLELMTLAHFVGLSRHGYPLVDPGFPPDQLTLLTIPQHNISSTKIRDHVARGRSIDRLTPRSVARYIRLEGLYRNEQIAAACSSGGS